jgi:hypothetical protein
MRKMLQIYLKKLQQKISKKLQYCKCQFFNNRASHGASLILLTVFLVTIIYNTTSFMSIYYI